MEGPASALLLTFTILAPRGLEAIQGGLIFGGALLILLVLSGLLGHAIRFFTPNVVGVILMLIALGLLPLFLRFMSGQETPDARADPVIFTISLGLVFLMATLSYRLKGFLQTIALLVGMGVGSLMFLFLGRLDWHSLTTASWMSLPSRWIPSRPEFHWSGWLAFASAYLAVVVNSLGSIQGIANITDPHRLPRSIRRGILVNGAAGVCCGLVGVLGMVSYSTSPGVVLANRVASRYVMVYCGGLLAAAAFVPKLAALLSMIPEPVVGATLCVAMGGQIGVGMNIVTSSRKLESRDYFVVGLPLLLGTMVGFLPPEMMQSVPGALQVFLGNGLIVGIFMVLVLEHVLLRKNEPTEEVVDG
jgi:uracil permease